MTKKIIITLLLALFTFQSYASERIRIIGSSTVFPFMSFISEEFGQENKSPAPIVESVGTGGGFKVFCSGVGQKYPDISNASRPMTNSELDECRVNGIKNIEHVKIGYDGIVLANMSTSYSYQLSSREIFFALAKYVPISGEVVLNPFRYWNEINPRLPRKKIAIYGPPSSSGTRDVFVEQVIYSNCMYDPIYKDVYPNDVQRDQLCRLIREDGKYIEMGENDNIIVHKLLQNVDALGIFGYSFLENNRDFLQGTIIDGMEPNLENIKAHRYVLSRPLFIYIKEDHYELKQDLRKFVKHMMSKNLIGPNGYLAYRGLVPLSNAEYKIYKKKVYNSASKKF